MKKIDKRFAYLISLFVIGFFIRFFPVRIGFHYWDECVYLQHAEIISGFRDASLFNEFDIRPPLLPVLLAFGYQAYHSIITAHFVVSFISSLGILIIFLFARELFDEKVATLSALIYTFLPLNVALSHDILVDTLLPVFWMLVFLFCIKTIKTNKKSFSVLAGIFLGLSFLLKFTSLLLFFFIFLIFYLYQSKQSRKICEILKRTWLIYFTSFLVILPYLAWNFLYFGNPIYTVVMAYKVVNWDTPTSFLILYLNFNQLFPLFLLFGIFLLFYLKTRGYSMEREEQMLLIVFLIFFLSLHFITHKEIRFLLPVAPLITILSSKGFEDFLDFSKRFEKLRAIFYLVIVALLFLTLCTESSRIFCNLKNGHFLINEQNELLEAANWIKNNTPKDTVIYVNTQYPVIAYFSERKVKVLPFWRSFQENLSEVMREDGYYILFKELSQLREPTLKFVEQDARFELIKEIGNKIYIFKYKT